MEIQPFNIIATILITIIIIAVSISLIISIGYDVKSTIPAQFQNAYKGFIRAIFAGAPFDPCEAMDGRQISIQEFQNFLQSMAADSCTNKTYTVTLSTSYTKDDIVQIAKITNIAKQGELIYFRSSEPLGVGGLIIQGNPGEFPLKLWDTINIWRAGEPDPDILIKISVQGCDPYDKDCDISCSFKKGICDPECYKNNKKFDVPCDIDCVDANKDGKINVLDLDGVCSLDCYNNHADPQRAYDPDCVFKFRGQVDDICDPDTNGVRDSICDPDCAKQNGVCDFDCNGVVGAGNPLGLKDADCYVCDKKCNGFCSAACDVFDEDPDCPDGFKDWNVVSECCGNNACEEKEDCQNCPSDCPPIGLSCENFGRSCCPVAEDSDDYGCSGIKNLVEGTACGCDSQCTIGMNCTMQHCCKVGKFWDGTKCSDKADVLIVALKANMKRVYSDQQIQTLESKIAEFTQALASEGLGAQLLYLDEDKVSNIIATKVSNPRDWQNIDGILDQLIAKMKSKYIIIVGGYDRFVQAPCPPTYSSVAETDDFYADITNDEVPDVSIGRIPDPNAGDMDLLLKIFDTSIKLHKAGGLDLSSYVVSTPTAACSEADRIPNDPCSTGECFSRLVFKQQCPSSVCVYDKPFYQYGDKKFIYYVQHGSPSVPQSYDSFAASSVYASSFNENVLFTIPCWGGMLRKYNKVTDSIPMSFFMKGGAIDLASTDANGGAGAYLGTCSEDIDWGGIGTLYYNVVKKMSAGKRIGDAYREGKNQYLSIGGPRNQFHINIFYGDPTLKIKKMW